MLIHPFCPLALPIPPPRPPPNIATPQAPLDRYVYKHGDLRLLKDETQWDKTWGFDFNQYAKVFRYAREQGIRLVGLNAPSSLLYLVNKVRVCVSAGCLSLHICLCAERS